MNKRKTIARYCYIERGWCNGTVYRYRDTRTGLESREYNWEEQCIDESKNAGYTIVRKNKTCKHEPIFPRIMSIETCQFQCKKCGKQFELIRY